MQIYTNSVTVYAIHIYFTGMEIGLRKRWRGSDAFIVFRVLACMPVDVHMNENVSDAHAQWFSCWKIKDDNCNVMK